MAKVMINAGHAPDGVPDPGAVGADGLRECDVALDVANRLKSYLMAAGVECFVMQDDNLSSICFTEHNYKPDAFISIHCNSAASRQAHGAEIYTSRGETKADELATCIMAQVESTFPDLYIRADYSDGDVDKEAGFYVLNNTVSPAVLLELAFISNEFEEQFLGDTLNQDLYARAIARGITDYLSM